MDDWKHESLFGEFIAESSTFPTAPSSPGPEHRPSVPSKNDLEAFQNTLAQVQRVETHLKRQHEDSTQVQHLIGFLKGSRKISTSLSIAQQYERLQPLRTWLFWMPISHLQNYQGSANSLTVIAHLYTVALLMERLFPKIGAAYFGSLSMLPLEEIARRIMSINVSNGGDSALSLMEFPITVVGEFRSRMGWVQPQRTASFPQFDPPNFQIDDSDLSSTSELYLPYSHPAFSYSAEDVSGFTTSAPPSQAGVSPMMMSSPFSNQFFLGVPSPAYGGAYSPASSTFEGSIAYSDTDELANFDLGTWQTGEDASMLHQQNRNSFGAGFVTPHQPVWI